MKKIRIWLSIIGTVVIGVLVYILGGKHEGGIMHTITNRIRNAVGDRDNGGRADSIGKRIDNVGNDNKQAGYEVDRSRIINERIRIYNEEIARLNQAAKNNVDKSRINNKAAKEAIRRSKKILENIRKRNAGTG